MRTDTEGVKRRRRHREAREAGFTLVELLVVILIIGLLAAIAIPVFISQKGKAVDASGREEARAAAQAAETYSTDHDGAYAGLELSVIHEYEPALQTSEGNNNAWVSGAEAIEAGKGYAVVATSASGDTFTWTRNAKGEVNRSCSIKAGNNAGGCQTGSW